MKHKRGPILAMLCASLLGLSPALGQEYFDFMPEGGKALLIQLLGHPLDTAELRQIAKARRGEEEWKDALAARTGAMSEKQLQTLVGYLVVNMPLAEETLETAEKKDDVTAALPPDGRELAWNQCQFCHSLFTSYLVHERGVQGWLSTFETPFHREIKMIEKERETFARYSAINMPMRIEDVPEELRF